jgi:hypothetical protein
MDKGLWLDPSNPSQRYSHRVEILPELAARGHCRVRFPSRQLQQIRKQRRLRCPDHGSNG